MAETVRVRAARMIRSLMRDLRVSNHLVRVPAVSPEEKTQWDNSDAVLDELDRGDVCEGVERGAYNAGYTDGWDDGRDPDSVDPRKDSTAMSDGANNYLSSPHYPGSVMATLEHRDVCEGVEMVREAHEAFGAFIGEEPAVPELTAAQTQVLVGYSKRLAALAQEMKERAAFYNGRGWSNLGLLLIRVEMLVEETGEWAEALASGDVVKAFHELLDVNYVADGSHLTLGTGAVKPAGYRELHSANMSKLFVCETCEGEGTVADGLDEAAVSMPCPPCSGRGRVPKVSEAGRWMKGPDTRKPDIARVLREAARGDD